MCDSCPKSFCVDCVTRNFGKKESKYVRDLKIWSCYSCFPTDKLRKIIIDSTTSLLNIESAYAEVRPPKKNRNNNINNIFMLKTIDEEIIKKLKSEEENFLQFFIESSNNNPIFYQISIIDYFTARDVRTLYQISVATREVFSTLMIFPGLFKTPYGEENNCKLFGKLFYPFRFFLNLILQFYAKIFFCRN